MPPRSPRKPPTCTKCKRPRAGHPRSGCPYTQTSPAALIGALRSIHLDAAPPQAEVEVTKDDTSRTPCGSPGKIVPSQSLMSLSSTSEDIVERLLEPGMLSGADPPSARVAQWQETFLANTPKKQRQCARMPGSLSDTSILKSTQGNGSSSQAAKPEPSETTQPAKSSDDSLPSTARPTPLCRSMSVHERDMFLSALSQTSGATAYCLPQDDVHSLQAYAIKIGFHAHVVANKDNKVAFLLVGRDQHAVQRLFEKVQMDYKKASFGTVAGGAILGAVGAWAGLAFS